MVGGETAESERKCLPQAPSQVNIASQGVLYIHPSLISGLLSCAGWQGSGADQLTVGE